MIDLSEETELLARRLADARHTTVDDAIRQALEASAATMLLKPERPRKRSAEAIAARRARAERFVTKLGALPVLDSRPVQEIVDDLNAV